MLPNGKPVDRFIQFIPNVCYRVEVTEKAVLNADTEVMFEKFIEKAKSFTQEVFEYDCRRQRKTWHSFKNDW